MKNHRTTCQLLLFLLLGTFALSSLAQGRPFDNIVHRDYNIREVKDTVIHHIEGYMAARLDPCQALPLNPYLKKDRTSTWWTDGHYLYDMYYSPEQREMYLEVCDKTHGDFEPLGVLKVNGNKITVSKKPRHSCSVERLGGFVMLVERDGNGIPVKAYYSIDRDDWYNGYASLLPQYLLMGCYDYEGSEPERRVIFGPLMPFFNCSPNFSADPGFYDISIDPTPHSISITYGGGRISKGDPSKFVIGLNGSGGRGAIMGAMKWNLIPTVEGLQVRIVRDEPFVDHMPVIGKEGDVVMLTKEACPFQDLPGKWAFASVIPLTHTLLKIFPKEVLTLMRGEIYARHGDTFKDPATQRYFDAQPWYKPTDQPVQITDLERFNYQLIRHVESTL